MVGNHEWTRMDRNDTNGTGGSKAPGTCTAKLRLEPTSAPLTPSLTPPRGCSFVFIRDYQPFVSIHVHSCSFVFIRGYQPFVSIHVHSCSFVFIRGYQPFVSIHFHSCPFVF